MSETKSQARTFAVLTAEPVRSRRKQRHWSEEEKVGLVAEAFAPGANVSAIARSHGLDPSQVYAWRRKVLASGLVAPLTEAPVKPVKFARFETAGSDKVEIVMGDVVVRVGGEVDADHLVKIIRAVRQA